MGYYIDLKNIDIEKYREILKSADLLPSRMFLKNDINTNFEKIKKCGVSNLAEYVETTKNKKKLQEFARQSGVDENYLVVLTREIKSYRQPPCKLKDFPEITEETISKLKNKGIVDSYQLYDSTKPGHQYFGRNDFTFKQISGPLPHSLGKSHLCISSFGNRL